MFSYFFQRAAGGTICFFSLQIVNTLKTFDLVVNSIQGRLAWCRARPTSVDDGLEDIRWIHGLGGESLPAASYVLPNPNKILFSAFRDGSMNLVICVMHSRDRFCFYHTPGQRPPHTAGHCVGDPRVDRSPKRAHPVQSS